MSKPVLFISDIHLGLLAPDIEKKRERLLVSFFEYAKNNACALYIIGDLFDYWFEYKRVYQKGFFRTLTALQDLCENGVELHYFIGNHDFLHKDFFQKEIGAHLYHDGIAVTLDGQKFFLAHGDGLVKNDIGYLILKKILRNSYLQKLYSLVHPDLGIALASRTSKTSRDYTAKKDYGEIDGMFEAAKVKLKDGFDYVIFGHSHKRQFEKFNNGYYINLGTWLDQPCYGIFQNNNFQIVDWQ
ncbi:MAG: UDP-2,3-diacylglucosamine diphosphatase [Ignavibacteria bacterium CG_4_8_14_3_um_filter_37_9]|nr:UDP-2,3-diacylglucosamine diphosphatase [Ignavibacteria bacterium]NCS80263.1 UDP-2,3-diacylglucosamine diphosphatase [Ignavibacteria bacterium]OIO18423.1 MAG: UDP-2,3-diacylglucosamine hydrolase [Ignavibacteria bacterium CG1_02_37_35]PIW99402.1 MAG: UDP-2,3-diacylglucosamine diphosphatase [Ignavibacteria bacterium CG_4_8_14_3_um_filter_37_9]PIX93761.1 MAG: UDP-2,3-diacylglucosamine diphosphatase [Ignavibacteria bacterium CG_4_10_14_3_um_filter_37_18]